MRPIKGVYIGSGKMMLESGITVPFEGKMEIGGSTWVTYDHTNKKVGPVLEEDTKSDTMYETNDLFWTENFGGLELWISGIFLGWSSLDRGMSG